MKKALLIDVSAIIYRFFYKLTNMRNLDGRPTGATFGLTNTLIKLIEKFSPDYVSACFDVKRESLKRREMLSTYKSARAAMPEDLATQVYDVKKVITLFGIESLSIPGYEADDVIGTLARKFSEENVEVFIFTGDKDLLQLVNENVKVVLFGKGEEDFKVISKDEDVKELLGVEPSKIIDLFGLQGDATDGIPGVKGIGPKTAQKLINQFGSLEALYDNLENITPKVRELLENDKDLAFLSKELATIHSAAIEVKTEELLRKDFDKEKLLEFLKDLGFRSVIKKLDLGTTTTSLNIEYNEFSDIEELKKIVKDETIALSIFTDENFTAFSLGEGKIYLIKKKIEELDIKNPLIFYNAKETIKRKNLNINFDVMIAAHLLNPEENVSLERISTEYLDINLEGNLEELIAKKAYSIYKLKDVLVERLNGEDLLEVFRKEELPLIPVLADMEKSGIKIDIDYLEKYAQELEEKIEEIEKEIYKLTGAEFNIASPQQLAEVLFLKLGFTPIKKTKNNYSTDNEVLEALKEQGIEVAISLLEYRKLVKLYNTYVKALPKLCDENGRVHTTFNQEGTATGRLSSSKPNLQNIPSRTLEGRKIRKAFVAKEGFTLIVADYSQIELRILASISEDEGLLNAYAHDIDLHSQTASILFLKEPQDVTRVERDRAKVVNFSIIYGKSSFGLSKELDIPVHEATKYIKRYFEIYKGIENFINMTILDARNDGFVKTLFGRKRFIPGVNSKNIALRKAAERMAVNAVIQGTQAEIIKRAMVEIYNEIKDKEDIKMLLQVHDELVFEVKENQKEIYMQKIAKIMENAIVLPKVTLKVNITSSKNWEEAK